MCVDFLSQQEIHDLPLGSRVWLTIGEAVRFEALLNGVIPNQSDHKKVVLLKLDMESMRVIIDDMFTYAPKSSIVAIKEGRVTGRWMFTDNERAEPADKLLLHGFDDLRVERPHRGAFSSCACNSVWNLAPAEF